MRELSILYQIVDGCAHLSENEILKAVKYCIGCDEKIYFEFMSGICQFKEKQSHKLMRAKRNPVLLILDDVSIVFLCQLSIHLLYFIFVHFCC